jgi:hypothetical protein
LDTTGSGFGVYGWNQAATGNGIGVYGKSSSANGQGVWGDNTNGGMGGFFTTTGSTALVSQIGFTVQSGQISLPPGSLTADMTSALSKAVYTVIKDSSGSVKCENVPTGTDDGTIQSCLTLAGQNGGGIVYVKPGNYVGSTWQLNIPPGVTLRGAGSSNNAPPSDHGDTYFQATSPGSGFNLIGAVNSNTAIEGITFDVSNLAANKAAIEFSSGGNPIVDVRIENNEFVSSSTTSTFGIHSNDSTTTSVKERLIIRGNKFNFTGASNSMLIYFGGQGDPLTQSVIEGNNLMFNTSGNTVAIYLKGGSSPTASNGMVKIRGNNIAFTPGGSAGAGISLANFQLSEVSGNTMASLSTGLDISTQGAGISNYIIVTNNMVNSINTGFDYLNMVPVNVKSVGNYQVGPGQLYGSAGPGYTIPAAELDTGAVTSKQFFLSRISNISATALLKADCGAGNIAIAGSISASSLVDVGTSCPSSDGSHCSAGPGFGEYWLGGVSAPVGAGGLVVNATCVTQ